MNRLAETLERAGYRQFYLTFGDSNLRKQDWAAGAQGLASPLHELVKLFLLQEPVSSESIERILGEKTTGELLQCEVLRRNGTEMASNSFYLLFCRSHPMFCQTSGDVFAYFGDDSLALATLQTPAPGGRVLDLCCGPGIQSFVAAAYAATVTGVEVRPETWRIAELNRRLNHMGRRVRFVCQSAEGFARSGDEIYDRILFNPPLIPMAPGYRFPLVANGGPDGLEVTRRILRLYHRRIRENGSIEFIGMGLGLGGRPLVCEQIHAIARRCGLGGRIHLLSQHPIRPFAPLFEACVTAVASQNNLSAAQARKVLRTHFTGLGRDTYWLFFAALSPASSSRDRDIAVIDMTQSFWGGWFV